MAERKINLDDRKYDALKRLLAAQGRDIDEEIIAQIEKLYTRTASEDEYESEIPKDRMAVYGIKAQGETQYFISSRILTLYQSAVCFRDYETYGKDLTVDSGIYECFGEEWTDFIRENLFSVLIKAMANDERITVAAVYNLDSETVKVYDRDGVTVKHYTLNSFFVALDAAEFAHRRNDVDAEYALRKELAGYEYLTEPLPPQGCLEAKLLICEAALHAVSTNLDYVDCKYTDPLIAVLYDTKIGLQSLANESVMRNTEVLKPYLKEQLDYYTDQLWADGYLEYYGWDRTALAKAIVCTIEEKDLRDFAYSYIVEDAPQEGGEHTDESYEITM